MTLSISTSDSTMSRAAQNAIIRLVLYSIVTILLYGCAHTGRLSDTRTVWEQHKKSALLYIYNRHPGGNALKSFGPVFRGNDSVVKHDGEVVGLKYHIAFYRTDPELKKQRKRFTPTHVVQYDLRTRVWSAGRIVSGGER